MSLPVSGPSWLSSAPAVGKLLEDDQLRAAAEVSHKVVEVKGRVDEAKEEVKNGKEGVMKVKGSVKDKVITAVEDDAKAEKNEVKTVEEKGKTLNSVTRVEPATGQYGPAASDWWGQEGRSEFALEQLYRSLRRCPAIPPLLSQFLQHNMLLSKFALLVH